MTALLVLLPTILEGIKGATTLFNTIREQARKTGELTPEEDAKYQAQLDELFSRDYWKPRP
jgi:hypothetical protein